MNKQQRDWSKVRRLKSPCQVSLRLSPEENQRLQNAAQTLGVSKAGYAKSVIFGQPIPKAARRPSAFTADLSQLLGLLGKLGSNANQIARAANVGASGDEVAQTLRAIQNELAAMRVLLLKALEGAP